MDDWERATLCCGPSCALRASEPSGILGDWGEREGLRIVGIGTCSDDVGGAGTSGARGFLLSPFYPSYPYKVEKKYVGYNRGA